VTRLKCSSGDFTHLNGDTRAAIPRENNFSDVVDMYSPSLIKNPVIDDSLIKIYLM